MLYKTPERRMRHDDFTIIDAYVACMKMQLKVSAQVPLSN